MQVSEKLRVCLLNWSEGEFKGDSQLSLIPELVAKLKSQGYDFSKPDSPKKKREYSNDPNVVNNEQEEDDIAKAIQLSLQTSKSKGSSSLYPRDVASDLSGAMDSSLSLSDSKGRSSNPPTSVAADGVKKARALYDFEAVEDNELTFHSGELVVVLDSSDPNWWKGSNHKGEGLFPSNFVTLDINGEGSEQSNSSASRSEKRVSFSECVEVTEVVDADGRGEADAASKPSEPVTGEINEEKIDFLLHLLNEADSTGERPDDSQLPIVEGWFFSLSLKEVNLG